ncbi:MAG: hypothetical protein H6734_23210 [Alphaproteobacteria bacterium]|nr:hypothetical protein [Alphaproteobacteria bacterium]
MLSVIALLLGCSTPLPCSSGLTGPEPLRSTAEAAVAQWEGGTGLDLCLGEVRAGLEPSLEDGVVTVRPEHVLADVFQLGCRELDAERGVTADGVDRFDPAGLPPGYSPDEARTEAFARACGRAAERQWEVLMVAVERACGDVSPLTDDERFVVDVLGERTLLPVELHPFEELGTLPAPGYIAYDDVGFSGDMVLVVSHTESYDPWLHAYGVPGLQPLWDVVLEVPGYPGAFAFPDVGSGAGGVLVADGPSGRVWLATPSGMIEAARVPAWTVRGVGGGTEGWWLWGEHGARDYDPVSGLGSPRETVDLRDPSSEVITFFELEDREVGIGGLGNAVAWLSRPLDREAPWTLEDVDCDGWYHFTSTGRDLYRFRFHGDSDDPAHSVSIGRRVRDASAAPPP